MRKKERVISWKRSAKEFAEFEESAARRALESRYLVPTFPTDARRNYQVTRAEFNIISVLAPDLGADRACKPLPSSQTRNTRGSPANSRGFARVARIRVVKCARCV